MKRYDVLWESNQERYVIQTTPFGQFYKCNDADKLIEKLTILLRNGCGDCLYEGHDCCLNTDKNTGEYLCENARYLFKQALEE